jgi:MATE family multidrug resistance protein
MPITRRLMNLLHESRLTLKLAVPLMIGQLSQMLLGVADTLMVGHLGVRELAALTFSNALFHVPFVFGMGLLTGISVVTSNARGANDAAAARGSCRHGLYLATAMGLLLFGISWFISLHLDWFGQPPDVTERSTVFFRVLMASIVPGLASIALKNHADALNRPWPSFWIFLGGVVLNIVLNWVMIHGRWGFPALGLEGAAWATFISRVAILVAMLGWLLRAPELREWVPYRWLRPPVFSHLRSLLAVGLPASLQMISEVTAFSLAGLIMGRFGPDAMAAHQIAITLAGTAFMIPLGLSMALTVRIGRALGGEEYNRLRPIAISGWILAAVYSIAAAALFFVFGKFFASAFVESPTVISLAASLVVIVGVFQLFDSLQVCSSAMLRGLKDSRIPAVMGFSAYWLVGLPVGAGLAFKWGWGAQGVWCGLAAGLLVAAVTLGPRLWLRSRSDVR